MSIVFYAIFKNRGFSEKNNSLIAPTEIEEAAPKTRQKRGTFCIKISAVGPNDLIFFQ